MKPILEIQNLSKQFFINHEQLPYYSFRDRLTSLFKTQSQKEEFWALNDVSFNVMPGDSVGIIGRNGAGKSTLLKILSRITPPTKGRITARGRIASLLEVGTGFHYELTGRENIFMNGSILGMKRAEIKTRFDEIVNFSGTEKFIDTPLKHYSSGMQLRLAFAVAAHLEPEILIIDEVLGVGDAEFQKKCLTKMEDVTGKGRTVLFVSHNLSSLKSICRTGVLLKNGVMVKQGGVDEVVDYYTSFTKAIDKVTDGIFYYQSVLKVHHITINGTENNAVRLEKDKLHINLQIEFFKRTSFELDVHIKKHDVKIASYSDFVNDDVKTYLPGTYQLEYTIEIPPFRSGKYTLDLFFTEPFVSWFASSENLIDLEIINANHHTFLNTSTLQWGSLLLSGSLRKE